MRYYVMLTQQKNISMANKKGDNYSMYTAPEFEMVTNDLADVLSGPSFGGTGLPPVPMG